MASSLLASDQLTCFVIMPFAEPFDEYYTEIIKPAAEDAKLIAKRADEVLGAGPFVEDIVNGISSAELVVAELTGRNPNVFYELGLSHGLGKPVIMLTQDEKDVPADLKAMKYISYSAVSAHWAAQLRTKLAATLTALLKRENRQVLLPFVHPAIERRATNVLHQRLVDLTGNQKQFLDYIRQVDGPAHQRDIERRFSLYPSGEVFYRLECLRLLGFLTSKQVAKDSSGKPIFTFSLSPDVQEIIADRPK